MKWWNSKMMNGEMVKWWCAARTPSTGGNLFSLAWQPLLLCSILFPCIWSPLFLSGCCHNGFVLTSANIKTTCLRKHEEWVMVKWSQKIQQYISILMVKWRNGEMVWWLNGTMVKWCNHAMVKSLFINGDIMKSQEFVYSQ